MIQKRSCAMAAAALDLAQLSQRLLRAVCRHRPPDTEAGQEFAARLDQAAADLCDLLNTHEYLTRKE